MGHPGAKVNMLTDESEEEKECLLDVSMVDGRVRN